MKKIFGPFGLAMGMTAVLIVCAYSSHVYAGDTCSLLSQAQVDTVLPGNNGGMERDTSEALLLKDVEMGHCSYLHAQDMDQDMDIQFLDLVISTASSDESFEQIDIGSRARDDSVRKLDIGDISFLSNIDDNWIKVSFSKGRTVIDLSLNANDAPAKSEQLIGLARIVAGKL